MALPRSARSSTICTTNAWRAGMSKALTSPWNTHQREHLPNRDHAGQRQPRQGERLQHGEDLGDHEHAMPVPPVHPHPRHRRHEKHGDLPRETHHAQQERRPGEPVHQPSWWRCASSTCRPGRRSAHRRTTDSCATSAREPQTPNFPVEACRKKCRTQPRRASLGRIRTVAGSHGMCRVSVCFWPTPVYSSWRATRAAPSPSIPTCGRTTAGGYTTSKGITRLERLRSSPTARAPTSTRGRVFSTTSFPSPPE